MLAAPISVLFTHYGDQWLRGSEELLLDLLDHLDPLRIRPIVWCNGAALTKELEARGITTYRSEFTYYFHEELPGFDYRTYMSMVRRGLKIIDTHGVRLLHVNSGAPGQWLAPIARSRRLPMLAHLHIDYLRRSRFLLLLHQADLVVGVSRRVIDGFLADGMAAEHTKVIHNGIAFDRFATPNARNELRARLGIAPGALIVTAVGSLIPRKGHDTLLRAFEPIAKAFDAHLLILSDGPERERLVKLGSDLGLADRLHLIGHVDRYAALPEIYQTSDIVALASRGDAFGLTLAEAGYFKLPVVSTQVGGIPEVIEDGVTGLLVSPDDPAAFTAALARLAADPALRAAFGCQGRARVERMFGAKKMAAEFMDAYERLVLLPRAGLGWHSAARRAKPLARTLGRMLRVAV